MAKSLNLNLLPMFESVYRLRSMTLAAQELHMTQSGISQHIKNLEEGLGILLFDRIKQNLIPTSKAHELYQQIAPILKNVEKAVDDVSSMQKDLRGIVRLGVPVEYGINVIVPLIAEFSREHPLLHFDFELGFASLMNDKLLKGELDFAFVDQYEMDGLIETKAVQSEEIELCMSLPEYEKWKKFEDHKKNVNFFESISYVNYEKENDILKSWFRHHYKKIPDCRVVVTMMDVQGILQCILQGMGAGVLPRPIIEKCNRSHKRLHVFEGSKKPLTNHMGLAYISERTYSPHVKATMDYLYSELRPQA